MGRFDAGWLLLPKYGRPLKTFITSKMWEDIVAFLALKVFNFYNFSIVSKARNVLIPFKEKPKMKKKTESLKNKHGCIILPVHNVHSTLYSINGE